MYNSKKLFVGGLNTDDETRLIGQDQYLNLENLRIAISEFGRNFRIENVPSTTLLYSSLPTGTNKTIGITTDTRRKRVIWFNQNSGREDGIYCYDFNALTTYKVLLSSNTQSGLNFSKSFKIYRNARVVGDWLLYTDNNNEPQIVDIEAGIKLNQPSYVTYTSPYNSNIPYTTLTLIRRPPIYRLLATKMYDGGFANNFIALKSYQFAYRYQYANYQYSALSTFSQLIPYNSSSDTYNCIKIQLSFSENVDKYAQAVEIIMRDGNTGKSFIIKRWDKNNTYDKQAIASHNQNSVQLGFVFYDNIIGIALDDVTANTSMHNVPLQSKTIEVARNRAFLGNNLKGYDTPVTTSLNLSLGTINTGGAGTYTAQWKYFYLTYRNTITGATGTQAYYYAYVSTLNPTSYFYDAYKFSASAPAPSLNASDATSSWFTETDLAAWVQRNYPAPADSVWIYAGYTFTNTGSTLNIIVAATLGNVQFFKSNSIYKVSIAFFDRFRRKCGYVSKYVSVTIPARTYNQSVFNAAINWTLNNLNPTEEIPIWAYYYQVHISKNQTTRFFVQINAASSNYYLKANDGTYSTATTFALNSTYAIGFDITALTSAGLGYTFTDGDLCIIYKTDGTNVTVPVLGTYGNIVLVKAFELGTLNAASNPFVIELYTPYKPSASEPLYETGDVMDINNPATNSRTYSLTSGTINGDCYAIQRDKGGSSLYYCEAMSPNDKVWKIWQTDTGWVNFIDTIGQQLKDATIDFSDPYINGTKTNGLNVFQALNTADIGSDSGALQKLQLANKQHQEDGSVMIAFGEQLPLSIYLGETQLVASVQNAYVAQSTNVIGTINALKNSYGTINPESVVEYNGTIWWVDVLHGVVCQYAQDGVTVISDYKMRRYWDRFSKRYIYLGKTAIETLCGFSDITTVVDTTTCELLITVPATETSAVTSGIPTGFTQPLPSYNALPSYASSIQNRFDIYDGQPKTLSYKFEENKWMGCYLWLPDCMEYIGNKVVGFNAGSCYLFNENTTTYNTIFGTQYPQRICFAVNDNPSVIRDVLAAALEANSTPNFTVFYSEYPYTQITDLISTDYTNQEGILYATVFMDRLSQNVSGTADEKLYTGTVVKSAYPLVMIEWQNYTSQLICNFINVLFDISRGHNQILNLKK